MRNVILLLPSLCTLGALATPAAAVDIVVYSWPETEHDDDPGDVKLMAIAKAAAKRWEALLPADDDTVITLGIGYDSFVDDSTLAEWDNTWSNIEVNDEVTFFFDETPFGDGEFVMEQTLFRDLKDWQKDAWFDGIDKIPGLMEVGFGGSGVGISGSDLLSVLMHEMGHALGINYAWSQDYDIEPWLLGFRDGAQVVFDGDFGSHLENDLALMATKLPAMTRRLPSAADIFALVDDEDWTNVNLERVDFIRNTLPGAPDAFGDAFCWAGGKVPGKKAHAFVRRGDTVEQEVEADIEWLTVGDMIDEPNHFGHSVLEVGGVMDVEDRVKVADRGELRMAGGVITSPAFAFFGDLSGDGNLYADHLGLRGTISADGGDGHPLRITIEQTPGLDGNYLDLDGAIDNGTAEVHAKGGNIEVTWQGSATVPCFDPIIDPDLPTAIMGCNTEELVDPYDGLISVSAGRTITFSRDWALGEEGRLVLDGGTMEPARLKVTDLDATLWFQGELEPHDWSVIEANTRFVDVNQQLGGLFDLWLQGDTVMQRTHFQTKSGELRLRGDLLVLDDVSLSFGPDAALGWDEYGSNVTTVAPKAELKLTASRISSSANYSNFSALAMVAGTLFVDFRDLGGAKLAPWTLSGRIDLVLDDAHVQGSPLEIQYKAVVAGSGQFNMSSLVNRAGTIAVQRDGAAGKISATGQFHQQKDGLLTVILDKHGYGVMSANVLYLGGALEVIDGGGWVPQAGDQYMVVQGGEMFGAFDTITLPKLEEPLFWQVDYVHQPTHGVLLTVIKK